MFERYSLFDRIGMTMSSDASLTVWTPPITRLFVALHTVPVGAANELVTGFPYLTRTT